MKRRPRRPGDLCYACDALATSDEHVPPKSLFPEAKDVEGRNLRRNLVTVPSCDAHNAKKSDHDMYLLLVLSTNEWVNPVARQQAMTKVARFVARAPERALKFLSGGRDVRVTDSDSGAEHDAVMVPLDAPSLDRSLDLIARGLYREHFGERWLGPVVVWTDFIDLDENEGKAERDAARIDAHRAAKAHFANLEQHGANPDVFWFKASEGVEGRMLRLCFYGGCTATVFFGTLRALPE